MDPSLPRRPLVPYGLALLAGLAASAMGLRLPAGLEGAAALLLLLAALARRRRARGLVPLLLAALVGGLTVGELAARSESDRAGAWLPRPGLPMETEFLARVRGLPEPTAEGEYLLVLVGHPLAADRDAGPARVLRLTVAAPSERARARLDRLGTGDLVRAWCRIVRPRGHANPGSTDPRLGLRARGLDAAGRIKSALLIETLERAAPGPLRWIEEVKRRSRRRLDVAVGPSGPRRAVLGAILLGDRAAIPSDLLRGLRSDGLVHLVAISGLHVGLLAAIWLGALRRAGLSRHVLLAVACVLLPAFGWAVGPRPPILRASLAALLALAGRSAGREGDPVNGLALIAVLIALARPAALLDAGFQLSFLATGGILLAAPAISRALPGPRWLTLGPAVSSAAYLWTAPAVAWHFQWLAPVALASNLVAAPLCALLLVSGYGAIGLQGLPLIGEPLCALARLSADALLRLTALAAGLDGGGWRAPRPSAWALVLYYLALCGPLLVGEARRRRWRPWILAGLGLSVVWVHAGPPPRGAAAGLEAAVIDVGQGQAVFLRGPGCGTALIDAGGSAHPRFDPGERVVLPLLDRWSVRRVDTLVASHGDVDHVGGAFAVLRELEVGELLLPPGAHLHPRLAALAALARERGVAVALAERGLRRRGGPGLRVLAPGRGGPEPGGNDGSVVVLAGEKPARLLVAGDLAFRGEAALLASGVEPAAEALVVGHHGAASGSAPEFLGQVASRHAVISCGFRNRFGHPAPGTLRRIEASGARVWRTDRDGLVLLAAGERGWSVTATRR